MMQVTGKVNYRSKGSEQVRRDGVCNEGRGWTRVEADGSSILIRGKAQHTGTAAGRLAELSGRWIYRFPSYCFYFLNDERNKAITLRLRVVAGHLGGSVG